MSEVIGTTISLLMLFGILWFINESVSNPCGPYTKGFWGTAIDCESMNMPVDEKIDIDRNGIIINE